MFTATPFTFNNGNKGINVNYTTSISADSSGISFNAATLTYTALFTLVPGTRYTVTLCAETVISPQVCMDFFLDFGDVFEVNTAPYYINGDLVDFSVDVEQEFTFFYPDP